ncbi:MAG: hypothetical protein QOK06_2027 [Acidimicrobiaceae bacterium]|jgi:hypothetical protein
MRLVAVFSLIPSLALVATCSLAVRVRRQRRRASDAAAALLEPDWVQYIRDF